MPDPHPRPSEGSGFADPGLRGGTGEHYFSISETGTLVYLSAEPTDRRLVLVDIEGRVESLATPVGPCHRARFSRDGRQLALITEEGEIHLYELESKRFSLLFSSINDQEGSVWTPTYAVEWSPDGTRLAVAARAPGSGLGSEIFIVPIDGRGVVQQVVSSPLTQLPAAWSPDGKRLLYHEEAKIWEPPLEPAREPRPRPRWARTQRPRSADSS